MRIDVPNIIDFWSAEVNRITMEAQVVQSR